MRFDFVILFRCWEEGRKYDEKRSIELLKSVLHLNLLELNVCVCAQLA